MPERLDRVTVATSHGNVVLPWASRDALLAEIQSRDAGRGIRKAFEAVGASRPVTLDSEQEGLLLAEINIWAQNVRVHRLPDGIWELRNALADDLHDAGLGS